VAATSEPPGERLGGAELPRLLLLDGHRVDGDDVGGAGVRSALDVVDADANDAHHAPAV